MIFDDRIEDERAKLHYYKLRREFAALVYDTNRLFMDCFEALRLQPNRNPADNHSTAILLARHVIEMIDAVAVLIGNGCAEPCKPLLRSALEAAMGMIWVIDADSERRSRAYQVADAHKKIKRYLKYDPKTDQGKAFAAEMADDGLWQSLKVKHDFPKLIQNLESMLREPDYVPIEQEFQSLKVDPKTGKKKEDPSWYALFGGPTNVRELAKRVKMLGEYEILYRYWSDTVHAGDTMTKVKLVDVGGTPTQVLIPVRYPERLQACTIVAAGLCTKAATVFVTKYVPAELEHLRTKYMCSVQERLRSLREDGRRIQLPH